jgi:hypothetical protein
LHKVSDYIKTKPKGFRLNFFVDEVGQFISENTKLMLNLQTIAETLPQEPKEIHGYWLPHRKIWNVLLGI